MNIDLPGQARDPDDCPANPTVKHNDVQTMGDLIHKRYSRRTFIKSTVASALAANMGAISACSNQSKNTANSAFQFTEVKHGFSENHEIAAEYRANILIRWGDPLFANSPIFDPHLQTANTQEQQFGFNNDFLGYVPMEPSAGQQERGILCVNHEYPQALMMFPNLSDESRQGLTKENIEIQQAAVGCSIVEIIKQNDNWKVVIDSKFNRRISARSTLTHLTGPATRHKRLQTSADPSGRTAIGTMNNCAGGITPWGTFLSCEENINFHFDGEIPAGHRETVNHQRYGIPGKLFKWGEFDSRFNVSEEPNEPNRFGWVVEIDPMDPNSIPKKRTALGRFKHEGAGNVVAPSGQLVIYMGDDQRFEYLYKFVSRKRVDLSDKSANADLLDEGTLYVARFEEDGTLEWKALVHGEQPLNSENGFDSQADVLIEARRAADLLGATPMDRPEDVVPNPETGKVYVMLTNNTRRDEENAANPRVNNSFGHIIEITEPEGDFASQRSSWDILVQCGDPENPDHQTKWHADTSENGWFASPDNAVIDPLGRLWVSTDQSEKSSLSGTSDGLWSLDTENDARGLGKMFYRCPRGAELCGPVFSPNGESLFLAIQHPGVNDEEPRKTGLASPTTRWPDFDKNMPPRPSVVVIQKKSGGIIG